MHTRNIQKITPPPGFFPDGFPPEDMPEIYIYRADLEGWFSQKNPGLYVSGNKFLKLKYNIEQAKAEGHIQLITFGGAYSNHIHALAAAGKLAGFHTIGIIRGERHEPLNPTLSFASRYGMQLEYISRTEYKRKDEPAFIEDIKSKYGDGYIIPEGGTNAWALKGVREITHHLGEQAQFDYWCCPCGTGGTLAGLISGKFKPAKKVLGFSVLKGNFMQNEVDKILANEPETALTDFQLINNYHFGGYAKINEHLIRFINAVKAQTGILLDPVYTGKMMYGIMEMAYNGHFHAKSKILAIHTGGQQGIAGMNEQVCKSLQINL